MKLYIPIFILFLFQFLINFFYIIYYPTTPLQILIKCLKINRLSTNYHSTLSDSNNLKQLNQKHYGCDKFII